MADYAIPADHPSLFPDEGAYSVVEMDWWKPPDSEDFINKIGEFDSADDVVLPAEKESYTYYVYGSDGEMYGREEWEQR